MELTTRPLSEPKQRKATAEETTGLCKLLTCRNTNASLALYIFTQAGQAVGCDLISVDQSMKARKLRLRRLANGTWRSSIGLISDKMDSLMPTSSRSFRVITEFALPDRAARKWASKELRGTVPV